MNRRLPALLFALVALECARAGSALAGSACPLAVTPDAGVAGRWPDLAADIQRTFAARTDVDGCAHVRITMPAGAIAVEVVLPDGRSASRLVSRPEDLMTTLQALLLVPAVAPAPPVVVRAVASKAPDTEAAGLGIELSVLAGTRIGDGQIGAGLGLLSLVEVNTWLAGFAARADGYQASDGRPGAAALVLAILGGRRFRSGTLALDLAAGPALAMLGAMTSVTVVAPASEPSHPLRESRELGASPRLLTTARLSFRARSVIRPFVGVDGEFGPVRQEPPIAMNEIDRIPRWTVGLLLGATAGTR
jgi:hypothetical protein